MQRLSELNASVSLRNVVNEWQYGEAGTALKEFFKSIFAQRGKLRPKRSTQAKVLATKVNVCDIICRVIMIILSIILIFLPRSSRVIISLYAPQLRVRLSR